MLIKNLTSAVQKVEVEDILCDRIYPIYVEPHSVATLEGVILLHKDKLAGIIEIEGNPVVPTTAAVVRETPSFEEESSEVENPSEEEEQEEIIPPVTEMNDSQFICEICKAEFASTRGLANHMARTHSNES